MKKLIYTAAAALIMLASASCEKKETVKEAQSSAEKADMVFTATSESGALKTTMHSNGTTVVWSEGDKLKVFTAADQTGSECTMTSGAGTATAKFAGQCDKKGPWTAICPSASAKSFSGGVITLTMPESQTYVANTFASGAMPCVAYSESATLNFKHTFGVLKLSLKLASGKTGSVKSIKVTTKGSEKLNGTFTVNPQNSAVAQKSGSDGSKSITLNCTNVALNTGTATDFWIVVPEGAFANGFDVTVISTDDVEAKISTTKSNTITAGKVKEMPVHIIEFVVPTTGETEITGGTKVKWVQLWKDGPKWAVYNVGATSVGEYGGYYCWGGNYKNGKGITWNDDHNTGSSSLTGNSDTATKLWGSNWRMPTKEDFDNLLVNCTATWKTETTSGCGVAGLLCTGKTEGYTNNSVFFPAAGYYNKTKVNNASTYGYYWSSAPNSSGSAYGLVFYSGNPGVTFGSRGGGYSVRAVLK